MSDLQEQVSTETETELNADDKAVGEIGDILEGKAINETGTDVSETSVDISTESDIPPEQMEAGFAAALSTDAIKQLAETNPAVLKALAEFHQRAKSEVVEKVESDVVTEDFTPLEYVAVPELEFKDAKVRQIFENIITNQNNLIDHINTVNKDIHENKIAALQAKQTNDKEFDAFVDNYFDVKVKESPFLGLTRSLNKEQLGTRQVVFNIAKALPNGEWRERLDEALVMWNARKGNNTESKIAAKLDQHKRRFIARPGGQKTAKDTRSVQDKTLEDFDKIAEEHNYNWSV